ncbi:MULTISPECIES: sensor histidine kinase KdpD [Rhodomicrobium]|uniref:sensor histidine kinase n=1 Tax=Rhodomicrobium TaxID=1068 RepID=UPI000B4BE43C|nr:MULTISPECIES: sensor histidine kinase KdpD [Rhodomicrobium]
MTESDDRPTPEALLEEVNRERRGKLKIFLGAFPGVGKTYAMLQAAQVHLTDGLDVVVGVVETHGRVETEALLRGLEIVPRQQIHYRTRYFGEMDVEAVIKRKPRIALVDELAHTNIPGSRHEKRYQDVEDLLAAGIDVYTTLNIQHIESLNDVVARISRIQVRETLPDKVLELASEIELIDLPPDDLIQRLRQGKVYMPEQAGRAITHFFSKGNLTALRELAMRIAAERVDAQMVNYMRAHAIPGPWPAQDRLLVCLNESPVAKRLVRTARRMAERQRIPWIALYVRTPQYESLSEAAKDRIADTMRLAERLEGEVVTIHAESRIAGEIIAYALKRNVTRLLVGRPRPRRWTGWLRETVAQELLRKATQFELTIVSPEEDKTRRDVISGGFMVALGEWNGYALATAVVAMAATLAYGVSFVLPLPNVSLIFMTAVIFIAIYFGRGPSIFASILSFFAYNIFFSKPYYNFSGFRRDDLLTIVFFLLVSVVVGNLAARLKFQIQAMRVSAQRTANLYEFSRKIAAAAALEDVLWAAVHHVASTLQSSSLVLLPQKDGRLQIAAGYPPEDQLALKDWGAAEWAWEHASPAGWKSETLPAADWLFLPMRTRRGMVGLLGVSFKDRQRPLAPDQWRLLEALVDQVAVAVERTNLASDIEEARLLTETEQLRSALLSSVSHDLRTPLVSILGSATTLTTVENLTEAGRRELAQTILDESERLNRFVQNLLDMTRLGYGALQPKREWCDMREIAGRALKQFAKQLEKREVIFDIPPTLPLVHIDPVLMEQVLANVIDNALKYTGEGGRVAVQALKKDSDLVVRISDNGLGIPPEARNAVFDIFYRVRAKDSQIAGTGLGLSICRGIVEAHGGRIVAKDGPKNKGTTIEITLPLTDAPLVSLGESEEQLSEEVGVT